MFPVALCSEEQFVVFKWIRDLDLLFPLFLFKKFLHMPCMTQVTLSCHWSTPLGKYKHLPFTTILNCNMKSHYGFREAKFRYFSFWLSVTYLNCITERVHTLCACPPNSVLTFSWYTFFLPRPASWAVKLKLLNKFWRTSLENHLAFYSELMHS